MGRTIKHASGMREHLPNRKEMQRIAAQGIFSDVLEIARALRMAGIGPVTVVTEPSLVKARAEIPEFSIERKAAKLDRRVKTIKTNMARRSGGNR